MSGPHAEEPLWLIWSNEHGMWWAHDGFGYTSVIEEAGRFTEGRAGLIVDDASVVGG